MRKNECPSRGDAIRVALLGLLLVVVADTVQAKGYMTPGFQNKESRPLTMALLPPHAEFIKAKAVMTDEMIKESQALEEAAVEQIVSTLNAKGYTVKVVSSEDLAQQPELRSLVTRINERYDEEWPKIVRKPKKVRLGRYSVGEEIVNLSSILDVDGVLISRIQAVGVTMGKAMLTGLLWGGQPKSYGRLDLSVIGGNDGRVEAYFFFTQFTRLKQLINKPEVVVAKASKQCFRKYPGATEVLTADKIAEAEAEEDDVAEEEVLAELEALLGGVEGPEEEEEEETLYPSTGIDPGGVPGETLGNEVLRRETESQILLLDREMFPDCDTRRIVNTEVLEVSGDARYAKSHPVEGTWKERWYLDRCGEIIPHEVTYAPDGRGGTQIQTHVVTVADDS